MNVLRPLAPLLAGAKKDTALIILNRPLEGWLLKQLWSVSVLKAVTDGGVDRLRACVGETDAEIDSYLPDLITGDFDSATPATLQFYREKNVEVIPTPDQDATDFTKCLTHVVDIVSSRKLQVSQVVVVGCVGGRADHYFSNIHTLYLASQLTHTPVFLLGEGNALCLLPKGKTTIMADTGLEDVTCGLLPIGCRCDHVTTTGLAWNLDDQPLAFGELVSSSNTYQGQGQVEGRAVTVETDRPLLWTMTFTSPQ